MLKPFHFAICTGLGFGLPCFGGLSLATCCSGVSIGGSYSNYSANLGNMNGLGLGTPSAGVSLSSTGNGQLYSSPMNVTVTLNGGLFSSQVQLSVKVSTGFVHSTVQDAYWCLSTCGSGGNVISTSSSVIGSYSPGSGQTVQLAFGINVHPVNGALAFTGSDSVVLAILCQDTNGIFPGSTTVYLTLSNNVQNAVQLTLASASGGLAVSTASDFSSAWGNVNGLGVGTPTSGLTVVSASGGVVYQTPYSLLPVFSSFTNTTCTLSAYVSSNFAHSALLLMKDAATTGGPYTTISLTSASPTSMTTAATSGSTVQRYLGIFAAMQNGAGSFSGSDNATLTFQMTVP